MSEDPQRPAVDLGKGPGSSGDEQGSAGAVPPEPDFDPYRFGRPDHPVPPEYAPPGYVPDPPASPYPAATNPPSSPYGPPAHPGQPGYGPPGYGQPGYGPPGYGQRPPWSPPPAPPYGSYPSPHAQQAGNGKAVAGLVLGIVSIVMCWLAFLNIIFLALGLVFGLLGLSDAKTRHGAGRGLALAGLICTGVGFVVTALYTVWVFNVADKCGGLGNSGDSGFSQCVRDHL